MIKSDLRNGMVVEYRDRTKRIVNDEVLLDCDFEEVNKLSRFNDDLLHLGKTCKSMDIIRIYPNLSIFKDDTVEPLWIRADEMDWSNIPFGTNVICWNDDVDRMFEGKFLRYCEEQPIYKFEVLVENDEDLIWKYCKLAEEVEGITAEKLNEEFDRYCNTTTCIKCKHNSKNYNPNCKYSWLVDNYIVSKK